MAGGAGFRRGAHAKAVALEARLNRMADPNLQAQLRKVGGILPSDRFHGLNSIASEHGLRAELLRGPIGSRLRAAVVEATASEK